MKMKIKKIVISIKSNQLKRFTQNSDVVEAERFRK